MAGTATATREPARDLNGVLIVFPECSVNAPDAHSIRIDSERYSKGANAHHNRLQCEKAFNDFFSFHSS